jgi:FHA domain
MVPVTTVVASQLPTRPTSQSAVPRRRARDLIEAVLENMRSNLEPLKYSTLAPSRYLVYLHPDEFARIEGLVPVLQDQTARALREAVEDLNRRTLRRYLDRFLGESPPVENPAREWQIEFLADPDGELAEGDILIHSDLLLAEQQDTWAGSRTRRITTTHVGSKTTKRESMRVEAAAQARVRARLRYQDNTGPHTFEITKDSITVGRGGAVFHVDVRIDGSVDVSREHLRIRRDPQSGRFFVTDLSSLGSTLDGQRLPKGYDDVEGSRRENGAETPLPNRARLGLADTIYVDFEVVPAQ